MKYRILQLDRNNESAKANRKFFMPWDILEECCGGFDIKEYLQVYEGDIESAQSKEAVLEVLWEKFNCNHPEDFHGHSLSVSDVVILEDESFFCDSIGWHKIS